MSLLDRIRMPETGMDSLLNSTSMIQDILAKRAKANLPFGGQIPPGVAGQIVGLEMLKNRYGENSPQYKQAKMMQDLNQESSQARINYQNILSNTAPKRFSTPFGKTVQELKDVEKGNFPGTENNIENPQEKEELENQYKLQMLKSTSDPKTRESIIASTNIDKTLDQLDPIALTSYSGVKGGLELLFDKGKESSGNPSEKYLAYTNAVTLSKQLAKQIRAFYHDSVTPGVQAGIDQLVNPSAWSKDPKTALSNFNKFVKTLKTEQQTFLDAANKAETFTGKKEPKTYKDFSKLKDQGEDGYQDQSPKIEKTKELNGEQYVFFDNSWHKVKR